MGHHIKQGESVVLEEVVLVPLQLELLPESVNQIDVNFHHLVNRQITEKRGMDEAFDRLVGRRRIPEVTDQHVAVTAFQGSQQLLSLLLGQVA